MLRKILPIAATFAVAAIVVTAVILTGESTAQDTDPGLPYNDNGTWTPEYFPVSDSGGNTVGVVRSADTFGEEEVYPHPVYSLEDNTRQIGSLGEHGYWAIGQPRPWCTGCSSTLTSEGPNGKIVITELKNADRTITRTTETTDAAGNTTTAVEIIEAGTDGEEGPTGNVND